MAKKQILSTAPGDAEWSAFLKVPRLVYAKYSSVMLEDQDQVSADLGADSPFRSYCKFRSFVSVWKGKPHARVTAIINSEISGDGDVGMLGYFEALEEAPEQTQKLLRTALEWLHKQGVIRVLAPMNFNTWHKYRLVDPSDKRPPFLLEPFNPDYYQKILLKAGFAVHKSYYSAQFALTPDDKRSPDPLKQLPEGITHRSLDLKHFEQDVRSIYDISVKSFGGNPEFMSVEWDEFWEIYKPAERITDPDFVHFLMDETGRDIAFAFAYRDIQTVLSKMQGQPSWLQPITYLLGRKKSRTLVYKSLGILPEFQGARLGSILSALIHENAHSMGIKEIIHALMEEDNLSRKIAGGGKTFRTYHLYDRHFDGE